MINIPLEYYLDRYEVTRDGRVISKEFTDTIGRVKKEIELKQGTTVDGYKKVVFCKNGCRKTYLVHRLVALLYIENPHNYPQINHKDESRDNNNVDNLEWCDVIYNNNYGDRSLKASKTTRNNKFSKPVNQYTMDMELINTYPSIMEAKRNGFHNGHIIDCCKFKTKHHKGYIWRYAND